VTVSALGVGRCIPFTVYNHCMISLGTLQLHRHCYSLSKSIEFVNFINEFRCLVIRSCLLVGHIPCLIGMFMGMFSTLCHKFIGMFVTHKFIGMFIGMFAILS
jgi:hypothetical protein